MKKIKNSIFALVALSLGVSGLTSCVEETFPTGMATTEIVAESAAATEALSNGMPAYLLTIWPNDDYHGYFGAGGEMIIREVMTGDYLFVGETGYSNGKYGNYARNQYMGDGYLATQFHWNYHYGLIGAINGVIRAIDESSAAAGPLAYLGTAFAFRAYAYLDLARMFEFLPNEIFTDGMNADGVNVMNLTVPIVKEDITEAEAGNNPRATREEMFNFILGDLDKAEQYVPNLPNNGGGALPDLSVVYGLKARLYMWVEDYANAKKYARLAIDNAKVQPITQADALNTKTGFNKASQFMWAILQNSESGTVQTGIINWTSWASNQTSFGYTGSGTYCYSAMDRNMYERISDTDWRKLMWKAPDDSPLADKITYVRPSDKTDFPAYASLKFRPANGDFEEYTIGAASDVPLMRVEEMYFIEAEAAEHLSAGTGAKLLTDFMQQYRDPNYTFSATDAIEEIVFQKRVELWGEGQNFFDIKRLDMGVTRGYTGTNWADPLTRINTTRRPAWMNLVIVRSEAANNAAVVAHNNPDPSDAYPTWTE